MSARQLCAVKGRIFPGALCGSVLVGMTECGKPLGRCEHQQAPPTFAPECKPGRQCERSRRNLGSCPAGYCNPPPAPAPLPQATQVLARIPGRRAVILDHVGNVSHRRCIQCGASVAAGQSEVCPHE